MTMSAIACLGGAVLLAAVLMFAAALAATVETAPVELVAATPME
jgi:hypothetical protein